jgi:hypothetical protein
LASAPSSLGIEPDKRLTSKKKPGKNR